MKVARNYEQLMIDFNERKLQHNREQVKRHETAGILGIYVGDILREDFDELRPHPEDRMGV